MHNFWPVAVGMLQTDEQTDGQIAVDVLLNVPYRVNGASCLETSKYREIVEQQGSVPDQTPLGSLMRSPNLAGEEGLASGCPLRLFQEFQHVALKV